MGDGQGDTLYRQRMKLIGAFDAFCQEHGIEYFAMEETLVGAITYHDLIPEAQDVQLGIMRMHFEELRRLAGADGVLAKLDGGTQLRLCRTEDVIFRYWIRLVDAHDADAELASARLQLFDAVTDDINLTTWQRFRAKAWFKAYKRLPGPLKPFAAGRVNAISKMYEHTPHTEVALVLARRRRRYPEEFLAATRRIPFGEGGIAVPRDTRCWVESDQQAESDRIRRVQRDSLQILDEVDRICHQHGIGYFLCAGTLLGAIRHKGFIPWDDDIDLGMLRDDYERFLEVAPQALSERFFLQTRATDPEAEYLFSKVRLLDTEYVTEYTQYRSQSKGISLDIFPFDRAPVEREDFQEHAEEVAKIIRKHRDVARHMVTPEYPHRAARNPMEALGHLVISRRNKPYGAAALAKTQAEFDAHAKRYHDDPSADYATSYVAYLTYLPLNDLLPYGDVEFEGKRYPAPRKPDSLMSMQFGDYRKEPPLHQRHGHAVIRWRTSDGHEG